MCDYGHFFSQKVEDNTMPIRRAVNSTRETPPKSKLAEGVEEKPGKVKQWTG